MKNVRDLALQMKTFTFEQGHTLIEHWEFCKYIYFIRRGSVL